MSPSMQVWKRVTLSLQGLLPAAEAANSHPKPRPLRLEHLLARNLLAADPGPAALQYTAGATLPGQFAPPLGFNENDFCVPYGLNSAAPAPTATPLLDNLNEDFSNAGSSATSPWGNSSVYGPLAMLHSGFAAGPSAYGVSGGATELDSLCAATEILIALLQGQLQSLLNQQANTNDPTASAWLQGQIDAVSASIIAAQSDLDGMNCDGSSSPGISGGTSSGYSSGSGTEGYSSGNTYGSTYGYSSGSWSGISGGGSSGMSGGSSSSGDAGTTGGYWPTEPGASSGSGGYSTTTGSYGASSGSTGNQPGSTWSGSNGSGPGQGSSGQTDSGTLGGTSGGYSGGISGSDGSSSWGYSSGYSSGTVGYSGSSSPAGTEPAVYSISDLRAGTFAHSAATEVGPVHEGQRLQVAGRVSVPRPADSGQANPQLIVQADLNFDGQFNDLDETIRFPARLGMESFEVAFTVRDDGPSPGNGTATDRINVRASIADQTATTSATVANVAPWFVQPPTLTFEIDAQGVPVAVVTAEFADPGLLDTHTLDIHWGDGRTSTASTAPAPPHQPHHLTRTLRVVRPLTGNERNLHPLNLVLRDDDTGEAAFYLAALDVRLNNDDDDNNTIPDQQERDVTGENDILALSLSAATALVPAGATGNYQFQYDTNVIRVWDSEEKHNLILPSTVWAGPPGGASPAGIPYTGQESVWVEGVSIHTTAISLSWTDTAPPETAEAPQTTPLATVRVTVWGLDLDIDSDNNNGFGLPENSDWEEYIEAHGHAIGKMLTSQDTHFTPVRLRLPRGLDVNDPNIRVTLMRTASQSGDVRLWNTFRTDPRRNERPVSQGGNLIDAVANDSFSLNELKYNPVDGGITIWLEAISVTNNHDTKIELDNNKKPADSLISSISGLPWNDLHDQVKFMVVHPESFYPTLDANLHVRNAFAAEAVYGPYDAPKYSMKELTRDEVVELLQQHLDEDEVSYFISVMFDENSRLPSSGSLKTRMYLDFSSKGEPAYALAFAGTELDTTEDALANINQLLNPGELSYFYAAQLGQILGTTQLTFTTTGHSLGGGLATASAIGASLPRQVDVVGTTYNAAGLQRHSLTRANGTEIFPGVLAKFNNAASFVKNYAVSMLVTDAPRFSYSADAPDILTFLQENIPALPQAGGLTVPGRGLYKLNIDELLFLSYLATTLHEWYPNIGALTKADLLQKIDNLLILRVLALPPTVNAAAVIEKMIASHSFPSIHYSLLHTNNWNAYNSP